MAAVPYNEVVVANAFNEAGAQETCGCTFNASPFVQRDNQLVVHSIAETKIET